MVGEVFAVYAAQKTGCKVTALTISPAQYDFVKQKIEALGLQQKICVVLCDYRDITGKFDRIISIEMLEAVGEAYWSNYFKKVRTLLTNDGRAAIQVITMEETYWDRYKRNPDFIQQYIFRAVCFRRMRGCVVKFGMQI